MPALPSHMAIGRGAMAGPVIGGYGAIGFGPFAVATNEAGLIRAAVQVPCDIRVQRVSYTVRAATADVDMAVSHNATLDLTGDTDLLAALIAVDAAAQGYAEKASGGVTTLVEAARDIAKGRFLMVSITSDAVDAAATDLCVLVHFTILGHTNADSVND